MQTNRGLKIFKSAFFGLFGLFIFLVPVFDGTVPILYVVNLIKSLLGDNLTIIAKTVSVVMLFFLVSELFGAKYAKKFFEGDPIWKKVVYWIAVLFTALVSFGIAPSFMMDERVGIKAITIGSNVFLTISITGWAVILILNSGIIEYAGVLLEPVMRPLFKVPGTASIDALSSFVSSPSIGVYITDQNYVNGHYTQREAFTIATSFSVMSIGYIGVLCNMAEIPSYYGIILISAFILVAILAFITVRIPPISKIPAVYYDGSEQTDEQRKTQKFEHPFHEATEAAVKRVDSLNLKTVSLGLVNALKFAFKIVGFAVPIVITAFAITYYTPVFQTLGKVVAPLLRLLQIPGADEIAPSTLIGLIEITLPTATAIAYDLPDASYFFVVLLSAVQIIFFTECVNAILASKFKAKLSNLIIMFFIRTIIAIPLVAIVTHIVF